MRSKPDTKLKILSGCTYGASCPKVLETSDGFVVVGTVTDVPGHVGEGECAVLVPRDIILEAAEKLREAPAQPKMDSEVSSDLSVETPATGLEDVIYENCTFQVCEMNFDEKATNIVQSGYCETCGTECGDHCICDCSRPSWLAVTDNDERLVIAISAALRETYEQGRKTENEECAMIADRYQKAAFQRKEPNLPRASWAQYIRDDIRSRLQKEGE